MKTPTRTPPPVAPQFDSAEQQAHAATLGVWIFLATELLFFGPLFFGYLYGRAQQAEAFAMADRHTDVVLGTINTLVLLSSSATMAMAALARKAGSKRAATWCLAGTAALGIAFLAIKGIEYRREWLERLVPGFGFGPTLAPALRGGAEMFFILYFGMTGLHAIHLLAGIGMTATFAVALRRGRGGFASAERIELLGLYWHFVDVIWIFLYPMLYLGGRSGG
jgi:cytochrome c oxidase subunit 3